MSSGAAGLSDEGIDDLIDQWHDEKPEGVSLASFLGWNETEYQWWVLSGERPESD